MDGDHDSMIERISTPLVSLFRYGKGYHALIIFRESSSIGACRLLTMFNSISTLQHSLQRWLDVVGIHWKMCVCDRRKHVPLS